MWKCIAGLILLGWVQAGFALTVDVGMLTQIDGNVSIATVKAGKHPATAFLKVAPGDKLVLGKNARVKIVYFETSRQEIWKGAGEIEIGNGEGGSSGLKAETRNLPPLVARQLVKTPVRGQHGKTGMVTVRSLSSETVESLEKQYVEFRSAAEKDDTTPEIFLLTGLMDMKEFEKAETELKRLRAEASKTPALKAVISHFGPLIREAAAAK